ncbi:hypothetical protein niasHT_000722 [Heterodera trifolii]|uniref:B30.2/SPRY domain-containing protein n=1 Tax=Heterodera trifolii TaxID=157864 RepID=A0ABD2MEB0_9BILA
MDKNNKTIDFFQKHSHKPSNDGGSNGKVKSSEIYDIIGQQENNAAEQIGIEEEEEEVEEDQQIDEDQQHYGEGFQNNYGGFGNEDDIGGSSGQHSGTTGQLQGDNYSGGSGYSFLQSQNDQKKILENISEMEKQTQKKVFLKFQENCWDSFACDKDIEISGDKSLIVHHKGTYGWCSVFAKYPILLNKHLSDFFYYEISVMKREKRWSISFGFAVKQQTKLDGSIHCEKGTYAFDSDGYIWINGEIEGVNDKYSYGVGDTVGIGLYLTTRQIIFTKNGLRLDSSDFLIDPSFADGSFYPFVSLLSSGDKIDANFGPNFKFDLATL